MSRMRSKRAKRLARAQKGKTPIKEQYVSTLRPPDDSREVDRIVPAKADGEVIGEAILYTDGWIDIIPNKGLTETQFEHLKNFEDVLRGGDVPNRYKE